MNINRLIKINLDKKTALRVLDDLSAMESGLEADCRGGQIFAEGLVRINGSGGKRLRPLLARICWEMGGDAKKQIVPLMEMLEIMHTTSLIHDDFVDGAAMRRGVDTISAREGWSAALQSGDYLLSCAMDRLKQYRGTGINEYLSYLAQEMCLGELEQHAGLFRAKGMTEQIYFERIRRKTALLMAASCRCGAIAGGCEGEAVEALTEYGMALGMAFQIRDDLTDWDTSSGTGKTPMQDLMSGVITLPVIYAMEERPQIAELLEKTYLGEEDKRAVAGAVASTAWKTKEKLKEMGDKAEKALVSIPDCAEKRALRLLAATIAEVK